MGWASEQWIEEFNHRYDTDAQFRASMDEQMAFEAWQERETEAFWREEDKLTEWFADVLIDHTGYTEIRELPAEEILIDDDIPF